MSGGVDSSVAAALLNKEGNEVVGVMLRLFDAREYGVEAPSRTCCSITDIEDARSAALRIGVPFHVFNYSGRFHQQVIDRFASAYQNGLTPNPCLDCNRYIKFEALLEQASAMGFDAIATGHYARVEQDRATGRWLLKKAKDEGKDQSYVLYTLTQSQLARLRLPLGELEKSDTRELAAGFGLSNAAKPDSQDICFIPDGDHAAFLAREYGLTPTPGQFIDEEGQPLGTHEGIIKYTVGQRRGLRVSAPQKLYVKHIDPATQNITLSPASGLLTGSFTVKDLNWIAIERLIAPMEVTVRTRYHQKEATATLTPLENGRVLVEYAQPQKRPAPGQAAVFYNGDVVVGGGTIE